MEDKKTATDLIDREVLFFDRLREEALKLSAGAIERNFALFLRDIARASKAGDEPEGTMTIRLNVAFSGNLAADICVLDCGWRRMASYKDDDYEPVSIDLCQPELPFNAEKK